jgi:hypothetical protein
MPNPHASLQNPKLYRTLRRKGLSKAAAARISNARTPGHTVKARRAGVGAAWKAHEDWLDGIGDATKRVPTGRSGYVRDAQGRFARTAGSASRSEARATLLGAHAEARAAQRTTHASERTAIRERHAAERASGASTAAGRAAERTALKERHASERGGLRQAHAEARRAMSAQHASERIAESSQALLERRKPATEATVTRAYGTDPNTSYELRHRLVDMSEIQASNTASGGINPKYDPALQPRDRSRQASQAQIDAVARKLNPDALVTDFHQIDKGAPIIDSSGNVLSGNGRTLALQRAADMHPDVYDSYKAKLKEHAKELGLNPSEIDAMKHPVLVRELTGDHDTAAFAREANSSGTLRMSPMEQAKVDAGQITDAHMLSFHVKEDQSIDHALRDPDNRAWVNRFMKSIPENEAANLKTRDGDLNQMGLYRAKAAIYTSAFPGAHGERMAESMLESIEPDMKSIQNGISGALPGLARVRAQTHSGERDPSLDLTPDIARAVDDLARIKAAPQYAKLPASQRVSQHIEASRHSSVHLGGEHISEEHARLLTHLDSIGNKPAAVRTFLQKYSDLVDGQPSPRQSGLFGGERMTRAQLLDSLLGTAQPAAQGSMF